MLRGGCEKTCHVQGKGLLILIGAGWTGHVQGFEFTFFTQGNHMISYTIENNTVAVGQKLVNVTASKGSIAPKASLAFQPPIGAATVIVWEACCLGIRANELSIYFFFSGFAVFAACLNALAVGAPSAPGFLIFSPEPAAILALLS